MFGDFMALDVIQKVLLSTVLVSIPEEIFVFMTTLILMGEFDYWKEDECDRLFEKWDYVRVFVPAVICALLSNILRYAGVDSGIITIAMIATGLILMVLTGDLWDDAKVMRWIGKAALYLLIVVLAIGIIDFLSIPFVIYATGKTLHEIQNNIFLFFMLCLTSRVIEYTILVFLIAKKRTLLKANIINIVFESKILTTLSFLVLTCNFALLMIMVRIIGYEKALESMSFDLRLLVIMATCILPVLNISLFFWSIYYVKNREVQKQKNLAEKLDDLTKEIKLCTNSDFYDNIKWKLTSVQKDMEDISLNLYHTPENN
ncbi:hypothetical protein DFR58_10574 [Anaerobacterium chartisolvens]|uniref:Uncharacterized protein n=1 Tax=Anaerobacterium chartisolvens TaxID=1297424 RepID=A0A369BAG7_9FIRM|nr:hypothetical protein [Anaerobacterium chartisolvens]RCX18315.1 hypothetical protein DFR58_10574 [Anaerobacterium chartisolvens]